MHLFAVVEHVTQFSLFVEQAGHDVADAKKYPLLHVVHAEAPVHFAQLATDEEQDGQDVPDK